MDGKAGKQPKRSHKTESAGQTAWRPYAPTGAMRLDDDDDDSSFQTVYDLMFAKNNVV